MSITITIGAILVLVLITRGIEFYFFMKKVSKTCHAYDFKLVTKNPKYLIDVLKDKKSYYVNSEWSAYNFMYLKGPSPKKMFFSFKPLTIESQYNKYAVNRLKEYEII